MNKIRIYKYLSFLVLLLSLIFIYPTFQSSSLPNWWSYFFPSNKINLGLDLRGGIFVVLGLDKDTSSSVIVEKEASKIKLEIVNKKYDLLIPIKYNSKKPKKNKGSAIFLHLTSNYKKTKGCVAIKEKDMLILLKLINKKTKIKII